MGAPYQSGRWWYWGQLLEGKLKVELPGGVAYHFLERSLGVGFLPVLVGALSYLFGRLRFYAPVRKMVKKNLRKKDK